MYLVNWLKVGKFLFIVLQERVYSLKKVSTYILQVYTEDLAWALDLRTKERRLEQSSKEGNEKRLCCCPHVKLKNEEVRKDEEEEEKEVVEIVEKSEKLEKLEEGEEKETDEVPEDVESKLNLLTPT